MKVIFLVISVFALTNSIRVPSKWPDGQVYHKHFMVPFTHAKHHHKFRTNNFDRLDIRPHKVKLNKYNPFGYKQKKLRLPPKVPGFHWKIRNQYPALSNKANKWVPIAPYSINTKLGFTTPRPNITIDLRQFPKDHYTRASSEYVTRRNLPLYNYNYSDDRENQNKEDDNDQFTTEPTAKIEVYPEDSVKSDHEEPLDIPTAPIYPGEGVWSKPGKKHKPFISKHKYTDLKEDLEEKPDGYDAFERGGKLFHKKRAEFENDSRRQPRGEQYDKPENFREGEANDDIENEEDVSEFVPMTMYAQVRRSEQEEHLPSDSNDSEGGRLKEVIKDSKILTVYTEEGYEDSAYDHAGHEKEAEDAEGYKEYNKEVENGKNPKTNHVLGRKDQEEDESVKITNIKKVPDADTSETSYEKLKRKKYPKKSKNNFMKTKATKTMELKQNPDGTQMAITSETKVMMGPDNGNTTGKIIEIMPIIVKYFNSSTPINKTEPNSVNSNATQMNASESVVQTLKTLRKKRYVNDFPKINVKEDFIDNINQSNLPKYKNQFIEQKYPYYTAKYIEENSPLRYSENMDNIPKKTEGKMAFYDQANTVECPEVDADLEVIPKKLKEVEEAVNDGDKLSDNEQAPRLGKLGQRIDCFKRKYFGENPLDSPFFKEKKIDPVPPLFKVLEERSAGFQTYHSNPTRDIGDLKNKKYHSKFSIQNIKKNIKEDPAIATNEKIRNLLSNTDNEELEPKSLVNEEISSKRNEGIQNRRPYEQTSISPDVEVINVDNFKSIDTVTTEVPQLNLITTPNYLVDITPKNIYDQIELLEFLPSQTTELSVDSPNSLNLRKAKLVNENIEQSLRAVPLRMKQNPYFQIKERQRIRSKRPQQVFDINQYLRNMAGRTKITPNTYKKRAEVPSREQIMPLEQMNVFADVLNNIKNGTNDPLRAAASSYQKPSIFNSFHNSPVKIRVPPKKIHIKTSDVTNYMNERNLFYLTSTTSSTIPSTTKKPRRGLIKYTTTPDDDLNNEDYSEIDDEKIYGRKKISKDKSTTSLPEEEDEEDSEVSETHTTETFHNSIAEKPTAILGLVPPSKWQYRTIYQPVEELPAEPVAADSEVINTYYVVGMKPPSTLQRIYDYSDFSQLTTGKGMYRFQKGNYRRNKRSPNRRSYFEVVRSQNPETTETSLKDEEDDYVPHRPKNWHWDEKLKKIVYDNPKPKEDEEEDDNTEVVEIEVEDPIPKNIQQTTTRRIFTTTTPLNGPSYVDFVKALKSNMNYISIPDPTTTKSGATVEAVTVSATTIKFEPTKPPEFLNILSKLKQSNSYVVIQEKNKTKLTTTTEEPLKDDEGEEDTEIDSSNIQNSPGRGAVDIGQNFKIFDVNDFLPKVKTYTPRTAIDYSKYKTIQRTPSRQPTTSAPEEEFVEIILPSPATDEPLVEPIRTTAKGKLEIIELSRRRPTTEATTTTTIKLQRTRGRRPLTTPRTTIASAATNAREDTVYITAMKPKRVYPRRKPTHIRTRTERQNEESTTEKVVRRRHNIDESIGRQSKIISLETIIMLDQMNGTNKDNTTQNSTDIQNGKDNQSKTISVDDILKNINHLKEINIEETVPDYTTDGKSAEDDFVYEENTDRKDEYFDDDSKISLDGDEPTNRKLVISKDKQQGMYYYASVR